MSDDEKISSFLKKAIWVTLPGGAVISAYLLWVRPRQMRWGSTDEEVEREMPGDHIISDPTFNATRAVTINTNPGEIWPWIAQMGYKRAGFYNYNWINNAGSSSSKTLISEYRNIKVGDYIPISSKGKGYRIEEMKEPEYMVWLTTDAPAPVTWTWGLYPVDESKTRLVTRIRFRHPWNSPAIFKSLLSDFGDIVLMRKTLLGIKKRAESSSQK